jgi:hypothetical protein
VVMYVPTNTQRAKPAGRSRYSWPAALLAQLVEHLHGKEGVNGSSPLEGFAKLLLTRLLGFDVVGPIHVKGAPGVHPAETDRLLRATIAAV